MKLIRTVAVAMALCAVARSGAAADDLVSCEDHTVERWRVDGRGNWSRTGLFSWGKDGYFINGAVADVKPTGLAVAGEVVYVGDSRGKILRFDRAGKRLAPLNAALGYRPDNLCISPDGKWLVYDRARRLCRRTFGAGDEPDTVLPEPADDMRLPEKVLLRKEGPITSAVRIPVSDRKDLAFGTAQTFFVRVRVRWDGTEGLRHYVIGEYDEHALAFEIFLNKDLWFSSRNLHKEFKGAMTKLDMKPGEHVFTGIRTGDKFFVAVDGKAPGVVGVDSRMALDHPRTLVIAPDLHPGEAVLEVEVGTGWPTNVSKARAREDLFK